MASKQEIVITAPMYPPTLDSLDADFVTHRLWQAKDRKSFLAGLADRVTAITRLRFVMEDPSQLLSNSVAHFIIDQLCQHDNQPAQVVIPGFSNITYPPRS